MNRLWVLGAADPEMAAIETLLRVAGERFVYALVNGTRAHHGNAHRADTPAELAQPPRTCIRHTEPDHSVWDDCQGGTCTMTMQVFCVECAFPEPHPAPVFTFDHHQVRARLLALGLPCYP